MLEIIGLIALIFLAGLAAGYLLIAITFWSLWR